VKVRFCHALAITVALALGQATRAEEASDFSKELAKNLDRYADDGFAKAVALCEARVKAKPDDYEALAELARLKIAKDDFEGAIKAAEQARTAAAKDAARINEARILQYVATYSNAESKLQAAPEEERDKLLEKLQGPLSALEKEVVETAGGEEQASKAVGAEQEKIQDRRGFVEVGKPLNKAIEKKDTAGKEIKLDEYKGKVLLVDFWATWCGPCVEEMPNVVKTYAALHEKGFEVIGISLDQDKAELDAFVERNKLTWRQYFDGKGWQNEVSTAFGVNSIPKTYLVDKEGKVRFVGARGPELEKAVNELLARPVAGAEKK
jgi:peroxiredoxin